MRDRRYRRAVNRKHKDRDRRDRRYYWDHYKLSWSKSGRWMKKLLSKTRRRMGKGEAYDLKVKGSDHYERECNWKGW
jgi:hypothetical protein